MKNLQKDVHIFGGFNNEVNQLVSSMGLVIHLLDERRHECSLSIAEQEL